MLEHNWKQLKSGTDIRGVSSEGVASEPIQLTDEVIKKISLGFASWLIKRLGKSGPSLTVSVGHDSRISANRIKTIVTQSLLSCSINVYDCSLSSTPAMFMTTIDLNCDAAIQITASHHPFNRNGLKFFTKDGGLNSEDIESILFLAQTETFPKQTEPGIKKRINFMDSYCSHLRKLIQREVNASDYEHPLKGLHIIVDAGNGVGGFYAEKVLSPLGADTTGSQFLEPDGMFPNHIPNPENEQAMHSISNAVVAHNADLGVIFDTDVDRGGAVDEKGNEINRNRLVAIASAIALEGNPGGTIVTDSITSSGLKQYIEKELHGVHHRFKRGYKNVINEAIRLNKEGINCPLAIETSGHAALRENYFLDDGAYLVTKIIIKAALLKKQGKTIASLLKNLPEPKESLELRIPIIEQDFKQCGNTIISKLNGYAKQQSSWIIAPDNFEGIRVSFGKNGEDGWFLLRLSVHDPIMPLNVESNISGGVKTILKQLFGFLSSFSEIDCSVFKNALSK